MATFDATRTDTDVELEAANHFLCMWFLDNPACASDYDAFQVSQEAMRALAAGNDEIETYLLLTDVKQWIRTLTGREWSN